MKAAIPIITRNPSRSHDEADVLITLGSFMVRSDPFD